MRIRAEIRHAMDRDQPIVALESTLLCHGLPYPENLEIASAMEEVVRSEGATPATIGVLSGEAVIGLDREQLERMSKAKAIRKCSRRDLPIVLAQGVDGATTVCGTMILAHLAGIRVLATGGIGGVHRGHPFDVSADLEELARTPMVVVCSGAKALLDLAATRERLETLGVPVLGFGTDQLPAFYSRESGLPADARVDTPEDVVAVARARDRMGFSASLLVAVPVPPENELPQREAEQAIARAVEQADELGVHGGAVTPFLLSKIAQLTGARSVLANRSLLVNNARIAARIAKAFTTAP